MPPRLPPLFNCRSPLLPLPPPRPAGLPGVATDLAVSTNWGLARVAFTSAPAWTQDATRVRVQVINPVTREIETAGTAGGLLPENTPSSTFLERGDKPGSWTAVLRSWGSIAAPIPREGNWRFRVALVSPGLPF